MNRTQRVLNAELVSGTADADRRAAIEVAAAGTLSTQDLEAICEKAAPVPAWDKSRHAAARARAPGARRTLARLTRQYSRCGTFGQALALFRAARGEEPDRHVMAALHELTR